jgi:hypothetical protein
VSVTEDRLGIRLPLGPGDEDNFVLGLAMDTTSSEPIQHPLDPTKPDLPAFPTLLVVRAGARPAPRPAAPRLARLALQLGRQGAARPEGGACRRR